VGQQVSVAGARTVLGQLATEYGEPIAESPALARRFPAPEALAEADAASLPMPRGRARALIEVARLSASGELVLDAGTDPAEAREQLLAIPGIGPWTADYVAMRALGDPDVFLAGDVALKRALALLGGDPRPERWRPWRSYAVMHLWRSLDGEHAVRASIRSPS
jgi:AraC family transcriptional regulator of adaptative response / DNA-3-methyladenine glycosylase II